MRRPPRRTILPLLLLAVAAPQTLAAHIRAKILRVGFPASGMQSSEQGFDRYRPGFWTPILVELNNDDGDLFEGALQARQMDRDGDQVVSTLPVAVRGTKEVFIYVPASPPQAQQPFLLRMVGPEGGPVRMFDDNNQPTSEWRPVSEPQPIAPATQVLLDISRQPLNQLRELATDPQLAREMMVARSSPASLPDSSPGLQMIDIVVWDDADPTQFRDVSQQQALLEWVQRGGTLVLGVARNWELLSKSVWGRLLPGPLQPPVSNLNTPPTDSTSGPLDDLAEKVLGMAAPFATPVSYCPIRLSELAPNAIPLIPGENTLSQEGRPPGDPLVFAASRPCGRGRIVLVAAEMQDLLSRESTTSPLFLRQILSIRKDTAQTDRSQRSFSRPDAFGIIEKMTDFGVTGGLYFLVAFLFVVIYILIATMGSWSVLQRRKRVHHAWTAFAVIAVIASGTSLFAVQIIRGIGNRVQQLCVVDAHAGEDRGIANCYFGLKTASHVALDLALPRDALNPRETADNPGGLMPLATAWEELGLSQYSAEARYQAGGPVGQLWGVPFRATARQFQGIWQGQLPGRIEASLKRRSAGNNKLSLDSWIENKLDADLTDCFLLVTGRDVEIPSSSGGERASRALSVTVYNVGTLPRGKRLTWLNYVSEQLREEHRRAARDRTAPLPEPTAAEIEDWSSGLVLLKLHGQWMRDAWKVQTRDALGTPETTLKVEGGAMKAALMVLSTYAELDLETDSSGLLHSEMERSRGFDLDRSEALTTRTALLMGFTSDNAGPARVAFRSAGGTARDWEPIEPSDAYTMYRFVIPLGAR